MSVGLTEMRTMAQRLFAAAVSAADPALAVRRAAAASGWGDAG
ncbi:hypothetical protein [Paracoccus sp. N5]|nr:hypothetical protein [Paracoccus sp. N5]